MSLSTCLPGTVVLSKVAGYLSLPDLSCLQISNSEAKAFLEEEPAVWWHSVSAALPSFKLSLDLFAKERRSQFTALFRVLVDPGVIVQPRLRLVLPGLPEARRLAKILASTRQAASVHRDAGGSFAEVAIVELRFDPTFVHHVFGNAKAAPAHELSDRPACLGKGAALRLAGRAFGGRRSLRLHLGMQNEVVFATARTDGVRPELVNREVVSPAGVTHEPLTLDLVSLSPALTLSYRGADLLTNIGWQALSSGIVVAPMGKAAASAALIEGFPCVVSLRDGVCTHGCIARTLNLDNPSTR